MVEGSGVLDTVESPELQPTSTAAAAAAALVLGFLVTLTGMSRFVWATAIVWIVGGLGTVLGPLLGAIGMPWLTQSLQFLQEYRFIVFGPILVALVIFLPHGIVGSFLAWRARRAAKEGRPHAQD